MTLKYTRIDNVLDPLTVISELSKFFELHRDMFTLLEYSSTKIHLRLHNYKRVFLIKVALKFKSGFKNFNRLLAFVKF